MDLDYLGEVLVEFKNLGRLNTTGETDCDLRVRDLAITIRGTDRKVFGRAGQLAMKGDRNKQKLIEDYFNILLGPEAQRRICTAGPFGGCPVNLSMIQEFREVKTSDARTIFSPHTVAA